MMKTENMQTLVKQKRRKKMFPLPEDVVRLLTMHLGVSDKNLEEA